MAICCSSALSHCKSVNLSTIGDPTAGAKDQLMEDSGCLGTPQHRLPYGCIAMVEIELQIQS